MAGDVGLVVEREVAVAVGVAALQQVLALALEGRARLGQLVHRVDARRGVYDLGVSDEPEELVAEVRRQVERRGHAEVLGDGPIQPHDVEVEIRRPHDPASAGPDGDGGDREALEPLVQGELDLSLGHPHFATDEVAHAEAEFDAGERKPEPLAGHDGDGGGEAGGQLSLKPLDLRGVLLHVPDVALGEGLLAHRARGAPVAVPGGGELRAVDRAGVLETGRVVLRIDHGPAELDVEAEAAVPLGIRWREDVGRKHHAQL